MRIDEILQMSPVELEQALEDKNDAFQNLKFQHATHQLDNPVQLRLLRKDIARINTVLRERELNQTKNVNSEPVERA